MARRAEILPRREFPAAGHYTRVAGALSQLETREEESQLGLGGVGAVAAVRRVLFDVGSVAAADGTGGRLLRVGRPHHLAVARHGILAFDGHDDTGARGHEADQSVEEGSVLVDRVE